jgi:hypothetical protein
MRNHRGGDIVDSPIASMEDLCKEQPRKVNPKRMKSKFFYYTVDITKPEQFSTLSFNEFKVFRRLFFEEFKEVFQQNCFFGNDGFIDTLYLKSKLCLY